MGIAISVAPEETAERRSHVGIGGLMAPLERPGVRYMGNEDISTGQETVSYTHLTLPTKA